jgi:hypothetical protein
MRDRRISAPCLEDRRGVAAEILSLEGRVGNRRALGAPLDHREEQVGI